MQKPIEFTLTESTDVFKVRQYLLSCKGIKKVYITTMNSIRVYYDDKQLQAKIIAKLIGTVGREQGKTRLRNIISIREVDEPNSKNAA